MTRWCRVRVLRWIFRFLIGGKCRGQSRGGAKKVIEGNGRLMEGNRKKVRYMFKEMVYGMIW